MARLSKEDLKKRILTTVDPEHPPEGFKQGKFLILITGGAASGKSDLSKHLMQELSEAGYRSDYIAKFNSKTYGGSLNLFDVRNAMVESQEAAFRQNSPIVIEARPMMPVFSGMLKKAKQHGYETILISPHIPADKYHHRAGMREEKAGRRIHPVRGLSTHKDFARDIDTLVATTDVSILLDNSVDHQQAVPMMVSVRGKQYIFNPEAFDEAHDKRKINVLASAPEKVWPNRMKHETPQPTVKNAALIDQARQAGHDALAPHGFVRRLFDEYVGPDRGLDHP